MAKSATIYTSKISLPERFGLTDTIVISLGVFQAVIENPAGGRRVVCQATMAASCSEADYTDKGRQMAEQLSLAGITDYCVRNKRYYDEELGRVRTVFLEDMPIQRITESNLRAFKAGLLEVLGEKNAN